MMIRFASETDLDLIAGLYVHNHKTTYQGLLSDEYLSGLTLEYAKEKWKEYLRHPDRRIWTAFEEARFLGFAAGMPDTEMEQTWYLDSLQVEESSRGKGVGTALIRAVSRYAEELGYRKMSICIVRGNERAGTLYRKLGAEHYSFFEDDFHGTKSSSEKLLWQGLPSEK